jgi:hypothetical protein
VIGNWKETSDESKRRWEANADFWDANIGEHSNLLIKGSEGYGENS